MKKEIGKSNRTASLGVRLAIGTFAVLFFAALTAVAFTAFDAPPAGGADFRYFSLLPLFLTLIASFAGVFFLIRSNYREMKLRDEKFKLAIGRLNALMFEYDAQLDRLTFLKTDEADRFGIAGQSLERPEEMGDRFGDVAPESREAVRELFRLVHSGAVRAGCTIEVRHGGAPSKFYVVQVTGVPGEKGSAYYGLGTIEDATQKIERERSLSDKANRDVLTGLFNRAAFENAVIGTLAEEDALSKLHAFAVLDVDNFKQINDTYGHPTGDAILQKVADVFRCIFPSSDFLGRFGGDEFVVFMRDIPSAKVALSRARTIADELDRLTVSDGSREKFTLSMGLSFCPNDGTDFNALYGKADAALYRAKHFPGNSYVVYDSFSESDKGRFRSAARIAGAGEGEKREDAELDRFFREVQLAGEEKRGEIARILKAALENREIEAYLQPKFTVKSLVPQSAEILARWNSAEYGLLKPNRFIPIYEKFGLIEEFDLYMLREACAILKSWKEKGKRILPLSVNQAPTLLLMRGYTELVKNALSEFGVAPGSLTVEITERAVFSSYRVISKVVRTLTASGVRVSLDDFGSGYTSLNMLKNLYVGELKIDKQFIDRLSFQRERSHIIIKHIVALAKEMGIETTMEGVETKEQAEFIAAVGCDTLQGYLFARPMSAAEFEARYLTDGVLAPPPRIEHGSGPGAGKGRFRSLTGQEIANEGDKKTSEDGRFQYLNLPTSSSSVTLNTSASRQR